MREFAEDRIGLETLLPSLVLRGGKIPGFLDRVS